jgi:hypothetical protein
MPAVPRRESVPVWRDGVRSAEQTRALQAILDRVTQATLSTPAHPPVVTFDLDSTLFDNRPRQLAILAEFAREQRLTGAEALAPEQIDGWQVMSTILSLGGAAGREDEIKQAWKPFWSARFFTSEACRHDRALPGGAEFVARVEKAGAKVVYFTGRHEAMRAGTVDSLAASRFPAGTLIMKPTLAMSDTEFKERAVAQIREIGSVVACFDNETTHVNRLKAAFPEATVVWLRTDHSPDAEPLPAGTPAIDGFLL